MRALLKINKVNRAGLAHLPHGENVVWYSKVNRLLTDMCNFGVKGGVNVRRSPNSLRETGTPPF